METQQTLTKTHLYNAADHIYAALQQLEAAVATGEVAPEELETLVHYIQDLIQATTYIKKQAHAETV